MIDKEEIRHQYMSKLLDAVEAGDGDEVNEILSEIAYIKLKDKLGKEFPTIESLRERLNRSE